MPTTAPTPKLKSEITWCAVDIVITRWVTETVALADLVVSATLVAVTVTLVPAATPTRDKSPEVEIVPADVVQVTAVLELPVTVAVNCSVPPEATDAEVGEMVTLTPEAEADTVMLVVPDLVVSCVLVAVIVTVAALEGAVKTPALVIEPADADQVTEEL